MKTTRLKLDRVEQKHFNGDYLVCYFDIETYDPSGLNGGPWFWYGRIELRDGTCLILTDIYLEFISMIMLLNTKYKTILIGHNGIGYDVANLIGEWNQIFQNKIKVNPLDDYKRVKRGKTWTCYTESNKAEWYFNDNMNPVFIVDSRGQMTGTLASHGRDLGLVKGETPIAHEKREVTEEDITYLNRDVEILRKQYQRLGAEDEMLQGRFTQSSTTQHRFRELYQSLQGKQVRKTQKPTMRRSYSGYVKEEEKQKTHKEKPLPKHIKAWVETQLKSITDNKAIYKTSPNTLRRIRKQLIHYAFANENCLKAVPTNNIPSIAKIIETEQVEKLLISINKDIRGAMKGGISYLNPCYKNVLLGSGMILDYTSLYPSILMTYDIPKHYVGSIFEEECMLKQNIKDEQKTDYYICEIKRLKCKLKKGKHPFIKANTSVDPKALLYEEKIDWIGGLSKTGSPKYALTSVELRYLEEIYAVDILELGNVHYFETDKAFTEGLQAHLHYYRHMKEVAKKGTAQYALAKQMLNTLWGRWGMFEKIVDNGGQKVDVGDKDTNYVSAIFTTAYGRITINKLMNVLGDNFIYCDTDSVHIKFDMAIKDIEDVKGLIGNIIDPKAFGKLSIDGIFSKARYIKSKTYAYEENGITHIKTAGSTILEEVKVEDFKIGYEYETLENVKLEDGRVVLRNKIKRLGL